MDTIQLARKLAELGQTTDAQRAYFLVLKEKGGQDPLLEFEAANYLFFSKGNYKVAFTTFVSLYNRGFFQERILEILIQGFYVPNIKKQQLLYEKNQERLSQYPYLFHKDFIPFEDLPVIFVPFDEIGYVPFYKNKNCFGEYINFNNPVINRYFFKDLDNPILAEDVYSQYQLEYLNDNVRESKWIARENHIYLHYSHWDTFCAYLACLDFTKMLRDEKFVFLIEDEISQYPIDFKERFGIDYSAYPIKPISIREINKLIWHTQLSSHNGGDFFNEILHGHPNLICFESLMFEHITETSYKIYNTVRNKQKGTIFIEPALREVDKLPNPTLKDCVIAMFLANKENTGNRIDPTQRIVPTLLIQPHFPNLEFDIERNDATSECIIHSNQYDKILKSPIFSSFRYIKTFTPLRRFTSSYGATVRFMVKNLNKAIKDLENNTENNKKTGESEEKEKFGIINDIFLDRVLNRSFMTDSFDRLYKDSVLVRFEDGKLNPKATFTALAEFLDIPYTESMTYCSGRDGVINPVSMEGNDLGFDPAAIYRTYDEFVSDADRALIEYLFRDAYKFYGYDFLYYHGEPVDETWIQEKLGQFTNLDKYIAVSMEWFYRRSVQKITLKSKNSTNTEKTDNEAPNNNENIVEINSDPVKIEELAKKEGEYILAQYRKNREFAISVLMSGLHFVNEQGQPLHMMPMLKLDPALLEQPLYH